MNKLYLICILLFFCGCSQEKAPFKEDLSIPPCKIIVLRHGETDWNAEGKSQGWRDIPLNENGKAQARELAIEFGDIALKTIYSCSLSRALETAQIISEPHKALIISDPTLRFYKKDKGKKSFWKAFWPITEKGRVAKIEREIARDAMIYFKNIAKNHPGETVLVVTHKLVIGSLQKALGPRKKKATRLGNGRVVCLEATEHSIALQEFIR